MRKLNLDAKPIWLGKKSKPNTHAVFFKAFSIENVPEEAQAYIAVDTKYWLYINGKLAVFEGGLFRESVPGGGYADKTDIAKYLISGENTIAVHVWYFGNQGRNNIDSGQGALIFQCEELDIRSDESFACMPHPAYYNTGEPRPSYLYGGHNLGYDARCETSGMYDGGMAAKGLKKAVVLGGSPLGELYERPVPPVWTGALKKSDYKKTGGNTFRVKLPYAMQAHPGFCINAKKGTVIDIRTDRYEVKGGPGDAASYNSQRIEYVCRQGENIFESILYLFGEELIISSDQPVEEVWLGYRESGYNTKITGKYECSCDILNKLITKASRTLYVCMRDNFMDCPDRERGQWIGDVSVQAPQVFFVLDQNAKLLLKKAINDFINLRKGDVLVGNIPGADFSELPPQSLNAISEMGLIATYYKYTHDMEVIRLSFEPCIKYLKLWDMASNGLVSHRKGDWAWFDHLHNIDKPVLENAWYYSALKFARTMSGLLGIGGHDAFLDSRLKSIKANFGRLFWNGSLYSSGAVADDRANALAVLSGLCEEKYYPKIREILVSVFNSSIYMENYVLSALCEMGCHKDAYHRMVSRYYNLAQNENTTLWEDFYLLGTKNHAWSGAPINIAFKYFLGIDTGDGFKTYTANPIEGLFRYQKAELMIGGEMVKITAN